MKSLTRVALALLAAVLVSAAPASRVIPHPNADGEALVIPTDSPVQFERFDKYGIAHFRGSFVLRGSFTYGCASDCEEPLLKVRFFRLDFTPDRDIARRLPHWRIRGSVPSIVITNELPFVRAFTNPRQFAQVRSGRLPDIRGRASILVDQFRIGIDCDAPSLTARFVRVVKAPKLASRIPESDTGCG